MESIFYVQDEEGKKVLTYRDNWQDQLGKIIEDDLEDLRPKEIVFVHNGEEEIQMKIVMIEEDDDYNKPVFERMVIGKVIQEMKSFRKYQENGFVIFQLRHILLIQK